MRPKYFERLSLKELKNRLNDEVILVRLAKGEMVDSAQNLRSLEHYMSLLQVNHQRVAACISHISLMLAALLISYNVILAPSTQTASADFLQTVVAFEVIIYLMLAVFLIGCLKDFGLDDRYGRDQHALQRYCDDFLNVLAKRYRILDWSNKLLRLGAVIFAVILSVHFLGF